MSKPSSCIVVLGRRPDSCMKLRMPIINAEENVGCSLLTLKREMRFTTKGSRKVSSHHPQTGRHLNLLVQESQEAGQYLNLPSVPWSSPSLKHFDPNTSALGVLKAYEAVSRVINISVFRGFVQLQVISTDDGRKHHLQLCHCEPSI